MKIREARFWLAPLLRGKDKKFEVVSKLRDEGGDGANVGTGLVPVR